MDTQGAGSEARLDEAILRLRRRYGSSALRRGGDPMPAAAWPTGIPALDGLTTSGGLPCGRISVLAGEGRGATGRLTLLQALTAAASRSMEVAYLDLAGSLDPGFLADLGADLDSCLVLRPADGGAAAGLAMARSLARAGIPWIAVALGRGRPAGSAAALEHALTALAGAVEGSGAVTCVAAPSPLPPPLAYASSLTIGCTPLGWQQAHGDVAGLRVRVRVIKSKLGAPGGESGVLLRYPRPFATAEVVGLPELVEVPAPPLVAVPRHAGGEDADVDVATALAGRTG